MKVNDLVSYSEDEFNDRLGTWGIVIDVQDEKLAPPVVTIFWETGEFERVYSDELEVINESR
jgi:hypothetical protein